MSEALAVLREERKRLVSELKRIDRAIRALGGKRQGRKPGSKNRKRRAQRKGLRAPEA